MTGRVGWLDCGSGVSGDMMLGALSALGVVDVPAVAASLGIGATATVSRVIRGALDAARVEVQAPPSPAPRRLDDVVRVVDAAPVPAEARRRAAAVFGRLAEAEARVHGVTVADVHFHEVGAVDAIVDVVAACAGLHALGVDRLLCSPIALGGGTTRSQHGPVPVPGPAVLELLQATDLVAHGGPADVELATPTGVALLAEWAEPAAALPAVRVTGIGVGAGHRDLAERPNVLRLVVGELVTAPKPGEEWQLVETNVDDLDPRLWPAVIDRLLAAGAADAWLTPILMKKGRPAHTLSALVATARLDAVKQVVFAETSAIGLRTVAVSKDALDRDWVAVEVEGQQVRVKVARRDGVVVNLSPEFDDVARAAAALDRPVKTVLAAAAAAGAAALGVPALGVPEPA